jgi:hypothetical protein
VKLNIQKSIITMLTFREFYEICEGKKPDAAPHAVPGTYTRSDDGTQRYTLQRYEGPEGKPTKKEVNKLVVKRSGGKAVKDRLKKLAKTVKKIEEQHPTMQPNEYNKQVARQSAKWKGMQIRQAHGEMEHEAGAQLAAKKARMKAIMSR